MQPGSSRSLVPAAPGRIGVIAQARKRLLSERAGAVTGLIEPWIERSWLRCLAMGHEPRQPVAFNALASSAMRHTRDGNQILTQAAQPILQQLGRALADTHYFAILTNARGVVVDVNGPIDRRDRRADLITRIGVDLSERSVGTTAIGAALTELHPVWLHRGEHFFDATSCYSCAGAPLFGPGGECVGMLDLTGVDAPERPELRHLVTQSARGIENALTLGAQRAILLRLNWPGRPLGDDADALIGLDDDGNVCTSNSAARQMLPRLARATAGASPAVHASELFALAFETLFDAARNDPAVMDLPLWSGLHLQAQAIGATTRLGARLPGASPAVPALAQPRRLRDIETALIRRAVDEARGNVAQAAARLGVSRATVYRRLGLANR